MELVNMDNRVLETRRWKCVSAELSSHETATFQLERSVFTDADQDRDLVRESITVRAIVSNDQAKRFAAARHDPAAMTRLAREVLSLLIPPSGS